MPDGSRTSWPAPILGLEVVVWNTWFWRQRFDQNRGIPRDIWDLQRWLWKCRNLWIYVWSVVMCTGYIVHNPTLKSSKKANNPAYLRIYSFLDSIYNTPGWDWEVIAHRILVARPRQWWRFAGKALVVTGFWMCWHRYELSFWPHTVILILTGFILSALHDSSDNLISFPVLYAKIAGELF